MNLDALKVSIKELKESDKQTVIRFSNVNVNVKTSYLKKLKDPIKYVSNLWQKKTDTQIRRLAKEDDRYNEIIGLTKLQQKMGFDVSQPTRSILDEKEDEADIFTELMRQIDDKEAGEKYQLIISETNDGLRVDNI